MVEFETVCGLGVGGQVLVNACLPQKRPKDEHQNPGYRQTTAHRTPYIRTIALVAQLDRAFDFGA